MPGGPRFRSRGLRVGGGVAIGVLGLAALGSYMAAPTNDKIVALPGATVAVMAALHVFRLSMIPYVQISECSLVAKNPYSSFVVPLEQIRRIELAPFERQHFWEREVGSCLYVSTRSCRIRCYAVQTLELQDSLDMHCRAREVLTALASAIDEARHPSAETRCPPSD